ENYNTSIKSKFTKDYNKYKKYYKNGDLELARNYYFSALANAFNSYTNNSINDFKKIEDIYINILIQNLEDEFKTRRSISD
ncbi:MAG: hypothetical protein KAT05_07275, partial [Spirochaetes bacterium]|nr:hypothetical protein [Spirochaetota bacterium]